MWTFKEREKDVLVTRGAYQPRRVMGGECGRAYPSTSITRFVDVAHAARADIGEDFVGTQTTPTGKGHLVE